MNFTSVNHVYCFFYVSSQLYIIVKLATIEHLNINDSSSIINAIFVFI